MSRGVVLLAVFLTGCATKTIKVPEYIPPPAACLADCPYSGPLKITTNGDLLEAYKAQQSRAQCLESRLQCVKQATAR